MVSGQAAFVRPTKFPPVHEVRGKRASKLKRGVKKHAPKLPGVYGMLDSRDRLIYVGKAKNLRVAALIVFPRKQPRTESRQDHPADQAARLGANRRRVRRAIPRTRIDSAAAAEVQRPRRARSSHHHYVCIGKSPAPYVFVTTNPTGKELGIYGPFVRRTQSEDAVRRLNDWFKLRDCPQTVSLRFAEQGELFDPDRGAKCLRFELDTCTGPCVGGCTRKEYGVGVRGVKAFLDGRNRSILKKLKKQMLAASESLEFEKAMSLRDKLEAIQWLDDRLGLLRRARNQNSFVYPLTGDDGRMRWYLIHRGEVQAVAFPPTAETGAKLAAYSPQRSPTTRLRRCCRRSRSIACCWWLAGSANSPVSAGS